MAGLLTKQLQVRLQIDRSIVYRMLKDERLTGVIVGNRWRFDRDRTAAILDRRDRPATSPHSAPHILAAGCLRKAIQKVLAELAGVATLNIASTGEPLTGQRR